MIKVKNRINKIGNQINKQVWKQIMIKQWDWTWNQVLNYRLRYAVWDKIEGLMWKHVEEQIKAQAGFHM